MRIRTVKPEFWTDEKMSSLPPETRLLAIALLNYSDDEGYFLASQVLVKSACFPFLESSKTIPRMIQELSSIGYLECGKTEDGRELGHIVKFLKHQRIDKGKPSQLKQKSQFDESSTNDPRSIQDASKEEGEGEGEQGSGTGKWKGMDTGRFASPEREDVISFFTSGGSTSLEAELFMSYYQSNGWMVGKNKMKDWKAAARGWIARNRKDGKQQPQAQVQKRIVEFPPEYFGESK